MKKILIMTLAAIVLALTTLPVTVSAGTVEAQSDSTIVQPRYEIINSVTAGLTIDTSGMADCYARLVSASPGSDCYITMELQQKSNGKWVTIKTWTASKMNGTSVSIEKDYAIVEGTYRVKVTGTIENSELGVEETAVKYSKEVVY